jgi:hypothetical protein
MARRDPDVDRDGPEVDDLEEPASLIDLLNFGLCPHGHAEDEGCDADGCPGGMAAWELPDSPFAAWNG